MSTLVVRQVQKLSGSALVVDPSAGDHVVDSSHVDPSDESLVEDLVGSPSRVDPSGLVLDSAMNLPDFETEVSRMLYSAFLY